MEKIGVRELRQHASEWLRRVARGESFEVTDRGRLVALLVPASGSLRRRLVASGDLTPAEGDVLDVKPLPASSKDRPLSALLEETRSTER